jgi:hypothetical protein
MSQVSAGVQAVGLVAGHVTEHYLFCCRAGPAEQHERVRPWLLIPAGMHSEARSSADKCGHVAFDGGSKTSPGGCDPCQRVAYRIHWTNPGS